MRNFLAAALLSTVGLFAVSGAALAHDGPRVNFGIEVGDGYGPGYYAPPQAYYYAPPPAYYYGPPRAYYGGYWGGRRGDWDHGRRDHWRHDGRGDHHHGRHGW